MQCNFMLVELLLLLLEGHSRSHVTCKVQCRFQTKTQSNYSKSYKIEYKVTFFLHLLKIHKYEESNIDLNLFLNCCEVGNCYFTCLDHSKCAYH